MVGSSQCFNHVFAYKIEIYKIEYGIKWKMKIRVDTLIPLALLLLAPSVKVQKKKKKKKEIEPMRMSDIIVRKRI